MTPIRTHPSPTRAGRRRGFSLVELLISIVLLGLVMGTVLTVLLRQQRFYRAADDVMENRDQLRATIGILPVELRSLASRSAAAPSDLREINQTSIRFLSTYGTGIVCAVMGNTLVLAPHAELESGNRLSGYLYAPRQGDVAFLFDDNDPTLSTDDAWDQHTVAANATETNLLGAAVGCVGTNGTSDNTLPVYTVLLSPTPPGTVTPGVPVRFAREVRYSLYQSGSDGKWYLGYQESSGAGLSDIQPVAGPFLPPNANPDQSGLAFSYFDANGNPTATPEQVARIDIAVRGETASDVTGSTLGTGKRQDAMRITVAIRNR